MMTWFPEKYDSGDSTVWSIWVLVQYLVFVLNPIILYPKKF